MATIASVHTAALALQGVLSTVTAEMNRSFGNRAAGKLNRVGAGLATLVADLASLDVLREAPAAKKPEPSREVTHGSDQRTTK